MNQKNVSVKIIKKLNGLIESDSLFSNISADLISEIGGQKRNKDRIREILEGISDENTGTED